MRDSMRWQLMVSTIILSVLMSGCMSQVQEQEGSGSGIDADDGGDVQEGIQQRQQERNQQRQEDMSQRQGEGFQRPQDRVGFGNRTGNFVNRTEVMFPQEAFDVCDGGYEGDECQFTFNEETVNGTCRSRQEGEMVCAPSPSRRGRIPIGGGGPRTQ
jgi:hypothetical protein